MTEPQTNQIYDLWVDRCREQLERGAAGNAIAAWMQAEGVSAVAAAEILRLAQAEPAANAEQPRSENSAPTAAAPTAGPEPGNLEAHITPPANPVESPRPELESPAAPAPDVQAQRARAHENAAAAFASAFSKSARLSRGGTSTGSPAAGTDSTQTSHDTPRLAEPAPQAAPAQPSPVMQPSLPGPPGIVPDTTGDPVSPPPDTPVDSSGAPHMTSMGARPPASQDPMEPPQPPVTQPATDQAPEPGQAGQDAHSEAQSGDYPMAQQPEANAPEDNGMPGAVHADKTPGITVPGPEPAGEMDIGSPQPRGNPAESIQVDEGGAQHSMAPNETGPGAQPGDRMPDQDEIEPMGVDIGRQDDLYGAGSETPAPAEETAEEPAPSEIAGGPEPSSAMADQRSFQEPARPEESPEDPVSPVVESHSAEPESRTGSGSNRTDDGLPDKVERVIGQADNGATAFDGDSAAGPDESSGATSSETSKRRTFGRRNSAHPDPVVDREQGSPTTPNDDNHELPAEEATAQPAESELMRLLDEADRAADPEPRMPPRLAKPKSDKELADAAKLLGISFRDDPKRPRERLQLDEGDETVKVARQLGIRFREEPESAGTPDLDDPMKRAALEMGISFRDADRPSSEQKSALRRYWPIVLVLALAAIAMPIAAVMLMFMGET